MKDNNIFLKARRASILIATGATCGKGRK